MNKPGRDFLVFTKKLLDELRNLGVSLSSIQKQVDAIRKQQESHQNGDNVPLPIDLRTELRLPLAVTEYCEAENCERKSWWHKVKTGLQIIGILSAFGLAILTFFTLREIRKQTPKIVESADAAKSAAGTAARELELTERPWVTVSFSPAGPLVINENGLELPIKTTMNNTGRSPAVRGIERLKIYMRFLLTPDPWKVRDELCKEVEAASAQSSNTYITQTWFVGEQPSKIINYMLNSEQVMAGMPSRKQFPPNTTLPPWYNINLAYCVAYYSTFSQTQYHTGYILNIARDKPLAPPKLAINFTLESERAPVSITYDPFGLVGVEAN